MTGLSVVVYWSGLDRFGLYATEGHRAVSAWNAADSGEWLAPRLFEQIYLRKPPGLQWLIGSFSLFLGQSEHAARAPLALCATLGALLSFLFAGRWFGWRWAPVAGALHVLTPFTWVPGRSAEIEAFNAMGTLCAAFALLSLLIPRHTHRQARTTLAMVTLGSAGIFIAGMAKGPASLPLLPALLLASCIARASLAPLARRAVWATIALGLGSLCIPAWLIASHVESLGQAPVTQGVSEFLWSLDRIPKVLGMPFAALGAAAPLTIALLFPFGHHAHHETMRRDPRSFEIAQTLALASVIALALYALAGVHNPRYAMPATIVLAPLWAYIWRGMSITGPTPMTRPRRIWARLFTLGHPAVLATLMLVLFAIYLNTVEPRRAGTSGKAAGIALAPHIPPGSRVIAKDMVEARPETLWYAARAVGTSGAGSPPVTVRWEPQDIGDPAPGTLLLLRTDDMSREAQVIQERGWPLIEPITSIRVHKYDATLYRVVERPR